MVLLADAINELRLILNKFSSLAWKANESIKGKILFLKTTQSSKNKEFTQEEHP